MKTYSIYGSGETLVLLHGALLSQAMWHPQIDDLSQKYRVITTDLPAHGREPDVAGKYTVEKLVENVIELLNTLNIEQTHLCGHSLGGMVAQKLVVTNPSRFQKLILVETAFGTKNTFWERIQTSFARPFLRITPQEMLVDLSVKKYGSNHLQVGEFVRQEMGRYDHQTSVRVMEAAFEFAGKEQLKKINLPTLVLVGADNRQTHAQGREMANRIPQAKYCVIKDANHLLNMDNPVAFNREVLSFLGE